MFFARYQHYNKLLNCTMKGSVEQNFVPVLKEIQLSSQLPFNP